MKNKKWFIILGIVALLAIVAIGIYKNSQRRPAADGRIRIGVILPLTGDWSSFGNQMVNGIQLWQKEHPEAEVEVFFEDGKGLAKESIDVLNTDLWQRDIRIYISGFSAAILGMGPVIVKNDAFLINAGATNPQIKAFGNNVFTLIPDADVEAKFIARFVFEELNEKKCFVYHQNDDSGNGLANVFTKTYVGLGGNIVGRESIQSDNEIANVLQKIRLTKSKVVFIPANGAYVAKIIRQAKNLNMNDIIWVGYAGAETPEIIRLLSGLGDVKLVFSTYSFSNNAVHNDRTKAFIRGYQDVYGIAPAYYAATCYDAIDLIFKAYQKCGKENEISKTIRNMKYFNGVSGNYEIMGNNHVSSGMSLKMFYNGKIVPFDKALFYGRQ